MAPPPHGPAPPRRRIWLAVAVAWALFALVNATQAYLSMLTHGHSFPRLLAFYGAVWGVWGLFTPVVLFLVARFPLVPWAWRSIAAHAAAAGALATLHVAAWTALSVAIRPFDAMSTTSFRGNALSLLVSLPSEILIYGLIVGIATAGGALRRLHRREVEARTLAAQLAEAKLHALELQIRPHFLFNTLNTATGLIRSGQSREAIETIVRLTDLLHQTLETERQPLIPLRRELDLLRAYLEIESLRFSDRLRISEDVDEAALEVPIPPFVLQPLAENAIRHGLARAAGPGELRLAIRRRGERLEIELFNTGPGLGRDDGSGVGLRNTRARLAQTYRSAASLTLDETAGGVLARLSVPVAPPMEAAGA